MQVIKKKYLKDKLTIKDKLIKKLLSFGINTIDENLYKIKRFDGFYYLVPTTPALPYGFLTNVLGYNKECGFLLYLKGIPFLENDSFSEEPFKNREFLEKNGDIFLENYKKRWGRERNI